VRRRGATGLAGILLLDKPAGMTSHDVVAVVRRETGEGRVGHAGTLDPMATGLLVVLMGPFTRLEPFLSTSAKSYDARIVFGSETDTDDAEGSVVATAPVPDEVRDPEYARSVLAAGVGPVSQVPPAYSAIKVGGRVAHHAARAGRPLDLEARPVDVVSATLTAIDPSTPSWDVAYTVSKGTYVRALARDLGRACGTAAHLGVLRRTASGRLNVADAHTLDEVAAAAAEGDIERLFADPLQALGLEVVEADAAGLANGRSLPFRAAMGAAGDDSLFAVTTDGALAGVYRAREDRLVPVVVLTGGGAS
jgi:tRNA pseudouridine55 synthase